MSTGTDDDDRGTGPVLAPDAEPSAAERARASAFAQLVDDALRGRSPPPAMSADDRALLEVATVIRAGTGGLPLSPARRDALVEGALRQAIAGPGAARRGAAAPPAPSAGSAPAVAIDRGRARRWAPWVVASASALVAAAAVLVGWLRAPAAPPARAADVPVAWTSRPADPLIGPIAADRSGDAATRLDYIFADRLAGYRERRLTRRGAR
jgi:hypothetical protein